MPINKSPIMTGFKINSRGHKDRPSPTLERDRAAFKAMAGIKDPDPVDTTPDLNPVKTTRDDFGRVSKMEYLARSSGPVFKSVEEDGEGEN
jgi:hypothetical protein